MKKRIVWWLLLLFVWILSLPALAQGNAISVFYQGTQMSFSTPPVLQDGTTFVPMRSLLEALGYEVDWDDATKTVTATSPQNHLQLTLYQNQATVNGQTVPLSTPAYLEDGVTMVPLRFLSEHSGAQVTWDAESSTIFIESDTSTTQAKTETATLADSVVQISTGHIQGSGVILTDDGYIATNFHVMEGAEKLTVTFNDRTTYQGDWYIAGYDSARDLVVLKIDAQNLSPVTMGNSNTVKEGDAVTCIASPEGRLNVETIGQINGISQDILSSTAFVTGGSSGGGLFDANGLLIGIISSYDTANHYMAIPVNHLAKIKLDDQISSTDWRSVTPSLVAPENFSFYTWGLAASITWSPVYGADYYKIYTCTEKNGTYREMKQPLSGKNEWSWGFPYSFTISAFSDSTIYFKISTVIDGKESELSPAYGVTF